MLCISKRIGGEFFVIFDKFKGQIWIKLRFGPFKNMFNKKRHGYRTGFSANFAIETLTFQNLTSNKKVKHC